MVQQKGKGELIFRCINGLIMLLVVAVTLYPLLYVLAVSLSSAQYVQAGMVTIFPKGLNLEAYREVMSDTYFWSSYKNTIVYTVTGTALSLFLTTMLAYCLSRPNLFGRKQISFLILFTMFFSGSRRSCLNPLNWTAAMTGRSLPVLCCRCPSQWWRRLPCFMRWGCGTATLTP